MPRETSSQPGIAFLVPEFNQTSPDNAYRESAITSGRDPFNQTFRKFRSKTQWIGSVQPEKFRKNWSTFWGGPVFPVGLVGILDEWIAPPTQELNDFPPLLFIIRLFNG